MNSGVITKIEYVPNTGGSYKELDFIPFSGNFNETMEKTAAGDVFSFNSDFSIAEIKPETEAELVTITGRRATFKITDANGRVYTVGDTLYRAWFAYSRRVGGTPGSFNGYECSISRTAPTAVPVI